MSNNSRRLVTVYDKDGTSYTVSHLNAHDMVIHLGYTYAPGRKFTPVDNAPFQTKPVSKASEAKRVQAILDGVGTNSNETEEHDDDDDNKPLVFDAGAPAAPGEDTVIPATAPEPVVVAVVESIPVTAPEPEPVAAVQAAPEPEASDEGDETDAEGAPKRRGRPSKA